MNMRRNRRKNSSRLGSAPPTNPPTVLPQFANLLTKERIKYGVTVLVRVSINIKLLVLHFIHFIDLYSVGGATGCWHRIPQPSSPSFRDQIHDVKFTLPNLGSSATYYLKLSFPHFFLIVATLSLPKRSEPYWSNPPF